jgi:hypothetical protein
MYQDDAYGQAGLAGLQRALEKRNMKLIGEGTYERNTVAVKGALLAVRKAKPEAVVMISAYKPAAEFIKLARQIKFDPTFVNVSFVGSDSLARELGSAGAGVVITQVVPFPLDGKIPAVGRYQASLKAVAPDAEPGFVSLEGYLVGRTLIAALEKIDGAPTRKALIEAVQKAGSIDLGGLKLSYSTTSNRGSDQVFLSVIQGDGSFKAVDRLQKAGMCGPLRSIRRHRYNPSFGGHDDGCNVEISFRSTRPSVHGVRTGCRADRDRERQCDLLLCQPWQFPGSDRRAKPARNCAIFECHQGSRRCRFGRAEPARRGK